MTKMKSDSEMTEKEEGNVIALPSGVVGLASDTTVPDTYVKVWFECHDEARDLGYEFERMWLEIIEGDSFYGIGRLDNYPLYSKAEYNRHYRYEPDKKTGFPFMVEEVGSE